VVFFFVIFVCFVIFVVERSEVCNLSSAILKT